MCEGREEEGPVMSLPLPRTSLRTEHSHICCAIAEQGRGEPLPAVAFVVVILLPSSIDHNGSSRLRMGRVAASEAAFMRLSHGHITILGGRELSLPCHRQR